MDLSVISITPEDGEKKVRIDSSIVIEFSDPIDPFSVSKGISIYTPNTVLWSGPDMAQLDTKYKDILHTDEEFTYYPLKYTVDGNKVTIKPQISFTQNKIHYISIYPGNDVTRYVSKATFSKPVITRIGNSEGLIDITSSYSGNVDGIYEITFIDSDTINVVLNNTIAKTFNVVCDEELSIGDLCIMISGEFESGDSVSIDVFKASGVTKVYKNSFVTTEYDIKSTASNRIEDKINNNKLTTKPLQVVATIPKSLSVNNSISNPVTIKFNQELDTTQKFLDCINITKTSLVNGKVKALDFFVKPVNDTIKIYIIGTSNTKPIGKYITLNEIVKQKEKITTTII